MSGDTVSRNGNKWFNSSKVIWGLVGILMAITMGCIGVIWGATQENMSVNTVQNERIQKVETTIKIKLEDNKERLGEIRMEQREQRTILEEIRRK